MVSPTVDESDVVALVLAVRSVLMLAPDTERDVVPERVDDMVVPRCLPDDEVEELMAAVNLTTSMLKPKAKMSWRRASMSYVLRGGA